MKIIKLNSALFSLCIFASTSLFAENRIQCDLNISVIPSQKFLMPTNQYTTLKNDGSPMLLIGIHIHDASATLKSKKMISHQKYCAQLIGQQKDVYLSGVFNPKNIQIEVGDYLKLRNTHSSGKEYPFWADFYAVIEELVNKFTHSSKLLGSNEFLKPILPKFFGFNHCFIK